jgi:hypothetical protein
MDVTEEDLNNGLEHVLYEIRLLVGALSLARQRRMRLSLPPDAITPDLLSLAVRASPIELPALHASHLLAFFAERSPGAGHLQATQYLSDYAIDGELRRRLDALRGRVEGQVAPLTTARVSGEDTGPHSYSFRPGEFLPLLECCRRFVAAVVESRWLESAPAMLRNDWRETGAALEAAIADFG